ncbi:MAG TPA: mechanosensitive ion channel family protein [Hanamia sp.]|nr:mechanosensitive ion channel family protein [Hanamia sp.]
MKKSLQAFLFIFVLILSSGNIYAQKDTSGQGQKKDSINQKNDSLNAAILQQYNKKQNEIEQLRIADSITKANLETQINSLKATDNLKKSELQKQLEELKNKEAIRFAEKKAQIDSLRLTAKAYPVLGFFNDTLFLIYNKSGSFSAQERADAITERIKPLADNFKFAPDSIKIISSETSTDLAFEDRIIMSISDNDALWSNTTRNDLAKDYQKIIGNEVLKYRSAISFKTLAKDIALALLVILIVIFIIKYIGKLFRWTRKRIRHQKGKLIKGIQIKNYTLFDAGKEMNVILSVNKVVKWILIILVIYLALPVLFGIFPWTKDFADTLFGYILNPVKKIGLAFWNFLPNLITIIVILFVFRYVFRGIKYLKNEIQSGELKIPGFYPDWANPTAQIIRVLVFAFLIVVLFPYLPGSNSPVFKGVSVFLGFLFTFGSAGSLSNVISGLILTYMRLFKIGDRVKIGDVTGDVIEKSLLVTRIRTIKNEIISIPNSTVMNSHTINYSSDAPGLGLIINTTVTIGYDVPWKDMHQALIDAALRTKYVLQDPKPFVLQTGLEDFYVSYQINGYIRESNKQADIYSELHQNIQDVCNERGIEIMSPHYRASRDGNTTTIPESYLPKDYKSPGFNVNLKNEDHKSSET